ncbi:hypothetical protein [Nostoc sp. T09]|uniref:hypothetical protein n=1 Tax=Nostoc sp. T09 TaxID=1932621 RepID=UPI0015C50F70|nr:hypothetical protein [Nostoc sp. T09]
MRHRFSSALHSAIHCRPSKGSSSAMALLAFEETYQFRGGKSAIVGIFGAIAGWLNPDQIIHSGRCKCSLAPI